MANLFQKVKDIFNGGRDEDDYNDQYNDEYEDENGDYGRYDDEGSYSSYSENSYEEPKSYTSSRENVVDFNANRSKQLQVVVYQPVSYRDDVPKIAEAVLKNCSVVINLEKADNDNYLKTLLFLSGVAYARHCDFKNVANRTYIIIPQGIDVSGDFLFNELESSGISF